MIVSSTITPPVVPDLPVYSLSMLPLIVYPRNPIVSVAVKSDDKPTLITAVSIVLPTKIGLSALYPESGKFFFEKLGKAVSYREFPRIRELELAPEKMIKNDVPGVKLSRKLPFASVRAVEEEEVEPEFIPIAEDEPGW